MTEKNNGDEEDNLIRVKFAQHSDKTDMTAWVSKERVKEQAETTSEVFYIEETKTIGLKFNRPVETFQMDEQNADIFIGALTAAFMKLKEDKEKP